MARVRNEPNIQLEAELHERVTRERDEDNRASCTSLSSLLAAFQRTGFRKLRVDRAPNALQETRIIADDGDAIGVYRGV